jgi:dTDP-glucose 4,6-dehydratase
MGKYESLIEFVEDRPGHDIRYALDISKIKKQLKWKSHIDFKTGIEKTVNWYMNNQNWVRKIKSKNK